LGLKKAFGNKGAAGFSEREKLALKAEKIMSNGRFFGYKQVAEMMIKSAVRGAW